MEDRPVLLGDWFDLIGGTSTGSVIASLLALGYRVAAIRALHGELGPRVFARRPGWLFGWSAEYDGRVLAAAIERVLEGRRLDGPDLRTGLCLVLERLDTGSAWLVMNNPRSRFRDDRPDGPGNRHVSLGRLIRAGTAAPSFFEKAALRQVAPADFAPFAWSGAAP